MPITPEDATVITGAIDSALTDVHTAIPGQVESYDPATQTVVVKLQIKRVLPKLDGTTATEDLPLMQNVPVMFPRSAEYFLSFPIAAQDYGLVIFTEQSLDQWRSKGTNSDPRDVERHGLSGAIFVPGLVPNALALPEAEISGEGGSDAVLGKVGGPHLRIKGSTVEATSGGGIYADDFVAMAGLVKSEMDSIRSWANGHVHVETGASTNTPTPPMPTIGEVASSNLKADN